VDWNQDGTIDDGDEWIELYNASQTPVDVGGWRLTNRQGKGMYRIPRGTVLKPGAFMVLYGKETGLVLAESGDAVELLGPGDRVREGVALPALGADASYSRDGQGSWHSDWPPSPGRPNLVSGPALLPEAKQSIAQ
jgi:hypothetical protein